jgi:MinD superfamily P-loop ATPase
LVKEIVVLSGSGGTGKTAVAASLAVLVQSKVLVDCDVEAACLSRLLKPVMGETQTLTNAQTAVIDEENCNQCGLCERVCRFGAIEDVINNCQIAPSACIGCGFCYNICPEQAISLQENVSGNVYTSLTDFGPLVQAELAIMQENSGQLIAIARQKAKKIARKEDLKWVISDGPPGTGSPVLSSLFEANIAVVVVEPTPGGISDLEKLLKACSEFKVPAVVCLNQCDINPVNVRHIENHCSAQGVRIAARIPFEDSFTQSILRGIPADASGEIRVSPEMLVIWEAITAILNNPKS